MPEKKECLLLYVMLLKKLIELPLANKQKVSQTDGEDQAHQQVSQLCHAQRLLLDRDRSPPQRLRPGRSGSRTCLQRRFLFFCRNSPFIWLVHPRSIQCPDGLAALNSRLQYPQLFPQRCSYDGHIFCRLLLDSPVVPVHLHLHPSKSSELCLAEESAAPL